MFATLYHFALVAGCLAGVLILGLAVGLGWMVWFGGGRRGDDRDA
jgi:hypothetical protein